MKSNSIQDYILKNKRNLAVAAATADAWPEAREKVVSGFLDRLDARLKKKLKGWKSDRYGGRFFVDPYPGYTVWKPAWKNQYCVEFERRENENIMVIGVSRDLDHIGKRDHCEELAAAIREIQPSATTHQWWEARITLRSPAVDWSKPEVLWQMHNDGKLLDDVAQQLLELARVSEPFIDKLVRKYRK